MKKRASGDIDANKGQDVLCKFSINGESIASTDKISALKEKNRIVYKKQLSKYDEEVVKIVGQHLKKLGFDKTVNCLIEESQCELETSSASQFKEYCLCGAWTKADHILTELRPLINNQQNFIEMKFLLLEQMFLELLEKNHVVEALHVLQFELSPLNFKKERVHELSSLLMCNTVDDLLTQSHWEGGGIITRQKLLDKLLVFLPPCVLLPANRLEILIGQAVELQKEKCIFHNSQTTVHLKETSVVLDHKCSEDSFPSQSVQVLTEHCDEVWFLRFSHSGKRLATGSKDMTVIIWELKDNGSFTKLRTLEGHTYGVAYLAWSPDDNHLIACGPEDCNEVWVWHIESGQLRCRNSQSSEDSLTCCSWYKDSKRFVVGGKRGQFYQCDLDGNLLESWEGVRVLGLNVLDEKSVLAADTHNRLRAYNFEEVIEKPLLQETHSIMSFNLSRDKTKVILNIANQGINMWDLTCRVLIRKFRGLLHGSFILHSCFGGLNDDFIACGGEDKLIYIWHHTKETPILKLAGHTSTVNCVHWNPTDSSLLASASDDGTVRIWAPKKSS